MDESSIYEAGLASFAASNHRNQVIVSKVPEVCLSEPCCLGIDEAGRGPVLGPMVYGITYCPESRSEELRKLGCADSKTLNEEQRDRLFGKLDALKDLVGWAVEIIAPGAICDSMFKRQKYSLNEVSYDSAIGLVRRALSLNVNVTSVFVDTVGPPDKYQAKLTALFPGIAFTVAKKADATYPVVSAASIFAKVTRDEVLKNWQFREPSFAALNSGAEKLNWGSGYPADPVTKKFLAKHVDPVFGFPHLVRFSWSTVDVILKARGVPVEWEDTDEEAAKQQKLKSFFVTQNKAGEAKRHAYFAQHKLQSCTDLF